MKKLIMFLFFCWSFQSVFAQQRRDDIPDDNPWKGLLQMIGDPEEEKKVTETEEKILRTMWEQEMSDKQTCLKLKMTENDLKNHLKALYQKANISDDNRVSLFRWVIDHDILCAVTKIEQNILKMMSKEQMSDKQICSELKITEIDLKNHLKSLYKKANVLSTNKVGLLKWAMINRFI